MELTKYVRLSLLIPKSGNCRALAPVSQSLAKADTLNIPYGSAIPTSFSIASVSGIKNLVIKEFGSMSCKSFKANGDIITFQKLIIVRQNVSPTIQQTDAIEGWNPVLYFVGAEAWLKDVTVETDHTAWSIILTITIQSSINNFSVHQNKRRQLICRQETFWMDNLFYKTRYAVFDLTIVHSPIILVLKV